MKSQERETQVEADSMTDTEFDVQEIVTQNPPQHLLQYRTAPLPTLKQGEAYFSQKVEA